MLQKSPASEQPGTETAVSGPELAASAPAELAASVNRGVAIAALAFGVYATSDALIKYSGAHAGVFEIGFFITLFGVIPLIATRPKSEPWSQLFVMRMPWLVHLRGIVSIFGSICSVYAFTHLPLAEAYALIFLVPFFVSLFSMLFLGEPIGWRRWLAVVFGFLGILLVVRPGFREITIAHAAGLGVAVTAGVNFVLMRKLAGIEQRTTLIATLYVYLLAAYGLLMLRDFRMPDMGTMLALLAAGCFSGLGHQFILTASKLAPASRIGPVQYSQIGWAIFYGIVFFGELPDWLTYLGLAIVAASGLFTLFREGTRFGWRSRAPATRPFLRL
jgi:drug/metabolite transporter (DMT)-like permease